MKYAKQNGIGTGNLASWLVNSWGIRQTSFCGFDQAITGAIYFTFHDGKSRLSIVQITHQFKFFTLRFLTRQIVENKLMFIRNFVACASRENLSNRFPGVQIPRGICTRFGRYLYSCKCSWIIKTLTLKSCGKPDSLFDSPVCQLSFYTMSVVTFKCHSNHPILKANVPVIFSSLWFCWN